MFIDGVLESMSNTWAVSNLSMSGARIGSGSRGNAGNDSNEKYSGFLSNFRVLKGTALYTSNFTPPTASLTAIANTVLLTLQNSTLIDNSNNALTLTYYSDGYLANNNGFSYPQANANTIVVPSISGPIGNIVSYFNSSALKIIGTDNSINFKPIVVSGGYGVNGNITFALSGNTLPDGLTFITTNGAITGTATSLANANTFTITANDDSFQTASNTFALSVVASTLTLLSTDIFGSTDYRFIPAFMDANSSYYGRGFSFTNPMLSSNGGAGNITFTVTGANTLPSGTFLYTMTNSDLYEPLESYQRPGVRYVAIGGVSEQISTKLITITANDDTGQSVSQNFTIYTSNTTGEFGYDGPPFANSVQTFGPWYSFEEDTHSTIDIGSNTSINLTLANVPSWSGFGNLSVTLSGNTLPNGLTLSTVPVANAWPPYLFGSELVPNAAFTQILLTGNVNSTVSTNNYTLLISSNTTSNTGIHYSNSIGVFALTVLQPQASVNALSFNTGKLSYYDYEFSSITDFLGSQDTGYIDQQALRLPSNSELIIANTVPYTVELWMKLLYDGGWGNDYTLVSGVNNNFNVNWTVFGEFRVSGRSGGSVMTISNIKHLGDDKWHHLAFVRTSGNNMKVYIDGYLVANSNTWSRSTESSYDFSNSVIGKDRTDPGNSTPFRGEISNFRITKTELYTGNTYTVPSLPLRPIVNTVLLIANSSNSLSDSSNNRLNIGIANVAPIAMKAWPRITRPNVSVTMTDPNNNTITLPLGQTVYPSFAPAVGDVTLAKVRGGFGDYTLDISPSLPSGLQLSPYFGNNTPAFDNTVMTVESTLQTYTLTATDRVTGLTASNTFNLQINGELTAIVNTTAFANTYSHQFNSNTHTQNITAYQTGVAANLRFNSSDITIEFWMKAPSTQNLRATITETQYNLTDTPYGSYIGVGSAYSGTPGKINWMAGRGTSKNTGPFTSNTLTSTTTVTDNAWHHIACVKSGDTGYLFVDGVLESMSSTWTGLTDLYMEGARFGTGIPPVFPAAANNWAELKYTGYLSNFRILKGTALYTSNFTAPNTTLTAIANTALLTFQDSTVIDRSNDNISLSKLSSITGTGIIPVSTIVIPPLGVVYTAGGTTLKTFENNVSVSFIPVIATGGSGTITYAISGNTLPAGLTFITSNGAIIGSASNVYTTNTFTITATDSSAATSANTFALQVTSKPLTLARNFNSLSFSYSHLQTANASIFGLSAFPLFRSNGGIGNITFEVIGANTLPTGSFLYTTTNPVSDVNRSDRYVWLGGVPEELKANDYTIIANDSLGQSVSNTANIQIIVPLVSTYSPLGSSITLGLTATNFISLAFTEQVGYGNISYTLTGNTLPTGLTFITSNAAIIGTPTTVQGPNTYTITGITNSGSYYANSSANITISTTDATPANVMSFNEVGSSFDPDDSFTWQGLAPLGTSALTLGSSTPFTIEFWIKFSINPAPGTAPEGIAWVINTDVMSGGTNGVNFWYDNGTTYFKINGSSSSSTGRIEVPWHVYDLYDFSWHHVALVRDGSSGKIFIDGTEYASTTSWAGINSSLNVAFIGNYQLVNHAFPGQLSNFRVTKTALYTGNFTVPTLPLVPIANTVLLFNARSSIDTSNNNLTIIDLNQPPTYTTGYI
jgi:hypothetical protein